MGDPLPTMFSIEEFPQDEQGEVFPETNPPAKSGATGYKSSPNLRRSKEKKPRQRTESASEVMEDDHVDELHHFRSRSRSAPSSLMVAARYGRELRRMSDEFDQIFTTIPRPKSASAAAQMTESRSFREMFFSLWRRKSKDRSDDDKQ